MVTPDFGKKMARKNLVISSIVQCLKFLGLLNGRRTDGGAGKRRLRLRAILSLVISNGYCLHTIANALEYGSRSPNLFRTFLYRACVILRYTIVAYVVNHSILSENSIFKCLEVVDRLSQTNATNQTKSDFGRVPSILNYCLTFLCALYATMFAVGMMMLCTELDIGEYVNAFLYHTNFLLNMPKLSYLLGFCEMFCYVTLLMVEFLSQAAIASVAGVITSHLSRLKILLSTMDDREIGQFCQRHTELYLVVEELNDLFLNPLAFWMVECLANFCLGLPVIVLNVELGGIIQKIFWTLDCIGPILSVALLMVSLSAIREFNSGLVAVSQVRSSSGSASPRRQLRNTFLLCKVRTATVSFKVLKCIYVDKTFVLSFFGGSVSFFIYILTILLQSRNESSALARGSGNIAVNATLI